MSRRRKRRRLTVPAKDVARWELDFAEGRPRQRWTEVELAHQHSIRRQRREGETRRGIACIERQVEEGGADPATTNSIPMPCHHHTLGELSGDENEEERVLTLEGWDRSRRA